MANITITIPDDKLTRVVTALCNSYGLPITNANAKKVVIEFVKVTVLAEERKTRENTATTQIQSIQTTKESDIIMLINDIQSIGIL